VAPAAPWVAAGQAFKREPSPSQGAMRLHSVESVFRAGRSVAASGQGPEDDVFSGRDHHSIKAYGEERHVLPRIHCSFF